MKTLVRVASGVLGVVIALLALAVTISFYSTYGTSDSTKWTFISLAIVSMAVKLLAPAAAASMTGFRLVQLALWLGFGAAVIFDSFGVAGYVEMTYGAKTGQASRYADDYKSASEEVTKLEADYRAYAGERPTPEVAAALDAAKGVAGKCTPRRAHLDVCARVAALEQEQARADERDKREALWREAKAKFDKLDKPSVTADPQAAVIARIGSRIGVSKLELFVAPIISILIFIFFEVVGPALMFAALHTQGGSKTAPAPRESGAPPAQNRRRTPARPTVDVLAALRELLSGVRTAHGVTIEAGRIVGSQRAIGQALGISGAKANRHLGELKAAGTIDLRTGPQGTVIQIL